MANFITHLYILRNMVDLIKNITYINFKISLNKKNIIIITNNKNKIKINLIFKYK